MMCAPKVHAATFLFLATCACCALGAVGGADESCSAEVDSGCKAAEEWEDEVSALQVHGGGHMHLGRQPWWLPRPREVKKKSADFKLIKADEIQNELEYEKAGGGNPECLQGLLFMDQTCETWPELGDNALKPCPVLWANEYIAGFGKWDGKCFNFIRKNGWAFGDAMTEKLVCTPGPRFCQSNADTHSPCQVGAEYYFNVMPMMKMVKYEWGWDRRSGEGQLIQHYPTLPVIDGHGKKTKWFGKYLELVLREKCPDGQWICAKSEWASTGQIGVCLTDSLF